VAREATGERSERRSTSGDWRKRRLVRGGPRTRDRGGGEERRTGQGQERGREKKERRKREKRREVSETIHILTPDSRQPTRQTSRQSFLQLLPKDLRTSLLRLSSVVLYASPTLHLPVCGLGDGCHRLKRHSTTARELRAYSIPGVSTYLACSPVIIRRLGSADALGREGKGRARECDLTYYYSLVYSAGYCRCCYYYHDQRVQPSQL
jgi:hypothetical protein